MITRTLAAYFLLLLSASTALAGETRTIAGTGVKGFSGDGGPADKAQVNNPFGLVRGPDGALYVCDTDNHIVRRIDGKTNFITTVAGTPGKKGYSGDGGKATEATMNEPYEVRFDKFGAMYVVERLNHVVRVISKEGVISTLAGTGKAGFGGDGGPAEKAVFNQPHSIQFSTEGDLYVCDILNHRVRVIRMHRREGRIVETFAGTGAKMPRPAPQAGAIDGKALVDEAGKPVVDLYGPRAIDFDASGDMYLALREGNALYRIDMETKTIHHVAGTGKSGFTGNGGPAKQAALAGPKGVSIHPKTGDVYLADTESHSIRKVDLKKGTVELVAGTGAKGDGPDGEAGKCKMGRPHGVFVDGDGVVLVGDSEAHRVRGVVE